MVFDEADRMFDMGFGIAFYAKFLEVWIDKIDFHEFFDEKISRALWIRFWKNLKS